jgi:hypothetical protein
MSTPSELSYVTKESKASGRSKKLFNANGKDVTDKDRTNPSSMPNQYAKVKNTVKGEEEIHDDIEPSYDLIHEFPEDAVNFANI